jgi:4-amino-4-deoxy-L-arabinose transferase-like glycosyltransferase
MLQTALAWLLVALLVPAAYPLARRLLARSPAHDGPVLAWTLALALALGLLTLVMFWLGLLGIAFDVAVIVIVYIGVLAVGYWVLASEFVVPSSQFLVQSTEITVQSPTRQLKTQNSEPETQNPEQSTQNKALRTHYSSLITLYTLLAAIALAVLFNAAYWPFTRDDAVGVYHPQAQTMAQTRSLLPVNATSLHDAYPMLIPLSYTFSYISSGWDNEYLARIIPALLALGCIPAAWLLARRMLGEQASAVAALIVAITPAFGSWAAHGYTDLPMGFYYALSAVFALRLWQGGATVDSLLAGVCMGLAAWTKNSALIGVGALGIWLLWAWGKRRIGWQQIAICAAAVAAVAAPWYVRNLTDAGFILPNTAWVDQAQPTLTNLLIFVTLPDNYGVGGVLLLAGIVWGIWRAVQRPRDTAGEVVIILWFVPFFAAWWLLASYDPRFLVSVLPLAAALAGCVSVALWRRLGARVRRPLRFVLLVIAVVLTAITIWQGVEFKDELLRNPLMSDAEKQAVVTER